MNCTHWATFMMLDDPASIQVLYSIPGADITNAPTRAGTVVLNLIFMFGLLVSQPPHQSQHLGNRV